MPPPGSVWTGLAQQLARDRARRRRRLLGWLYGLSGASLFLVAFSALQWTPAPADALIASVPAPVVAAAGPSQSTTLDRVILDVPPSPTHSRPVSAPPQAAFAAASATGLSPQRLDISPTLPALAGASQVEAPLPAAPALPPAALYPVSQAAQPLLAVSKPAPVSPPLPPTGVAARRMAWRLQTSSYLAHQDWLPAMGQLPPYDERMIESRFLSGNATQPQTSYTIAYPRRYQQVDFRLEYALWPRLALYTGLSAYASTPLVFRRGELPRELPTGPTPLEESAITYEPPYRARHLQIGLPLGVQYRLGRGRWQAEAATGLALLYQPRWRWETQAGERLGINPEAADLRHVETATGQTFVQLRPWQGQVEVALRLCYRTGPRTELVAGPVWQGFLNGAFGGLASNSQMRGRTGLSLGLRFE